MHRIAFRLKSAGVTMIELMIVVAIVGILVALAAPDMRSFFIQVRLDTTQNEVFTALNLARSEAIKRGVPVTIRRLSATSQEWTQGWEIFVDPNRDGVRDPSPSAGEELIRVRQAFDAPITIWGSVFLPESVDFLPDGRSTARPSGNIGGTFIICYGGVIREGTKSRSRAVFLIAPGRVSKGVDRNNDGQPENDTWGGEIDSCTNPI